MLLTRSPIETMPTGFSPSNTGRWRTRFSVMIAVYDERQRVPVTEGRNSPVRAIREQRIDLGFLGYFDIIAKLVPQIRKAKVMRRRQDGEHVAGIAPQHDGLGQTISRNPTRLGGTRG